MARNVEKIRTAGWIIDLRPEVGHGGGKIVAAGTPEDVLRRGKKEAGE